jgi:predicted DNA-binding transcriptional regulator YafY
MPTNKNAVIRYRYIDELLSNRHKRYSTAEITEIVNEKLIKDGYAEVGLRCIQKDIKALEEEVFCAEITRENIGGKECVYYTDPSYSIFTKKLSQEEQSLLSEILSTLGQFDGLDNFEWLDSLKQRLNVEDRRRIITFSHNPYLHNSNLLGGLFDVISNRVVIKIYYHKFSEADSSREYIIHPYHLKQFNDRWYLFGACDDGYIVTLPLDRIDGYEPLYNISYCEPTEDLEQRFEDIIGVTLYGDRVLQSILLWVSDKQYPYIETKPIHGSQKLVKGAKADALRTEHNRLIGGYFIEIKCIPNRELMMLLASFLDEVVLLSPQPLVEEIASYVKKMHDNYF